MPPVLGVTSYTPAVQERRTYALPCEYIDGMRRAGAEVVVLATGTADSLLDRLDGLVLAGGGDVDPALYGGSTHDTHYMIDPARDRFELDLVLRALDLGMPILAICRGMQILNVALGGTLVAHVPERWGSDVTHRAEPREPVRHFVEVDAASRLSTIVGVGSLEVVSWHHQAVDRLGSGLRVVARSSDGLPEAVEPEDDRWVVAVQWHPELSAHENDRQAALLRETVQAAAHYARRNQCD